MFGRSLRGEQVARRAPGPLTIGARIRNYTGSDIGSSGSWIEGVLDPVSALRRRGMRAYSWRIGWENVQSRVEKIMKLKVSADGNNNKKFLSRGIARDNLAFGWLWEAYEWGLDESYWSDSSEAGPVWVGEQSAKKLGRENLGYFPPQTAMAALERKLGFSRFINPMADLSSLSRRSREPLEFTQVHWSASHS